MRGPWGSIGLALLCAGLAVSPSWAGAWVREAGTGLLISQLSYYVVEGGFDDRGLPLGGARFERAELSLYVEYGLTDAWTIGAQPRFQTLKTQGPGYAYDRDGLGDWDVFIRRRLFEKGRWALATQATVKFGDGYGTERPPAGGNGALEFEPRLAVGRSVGRSWAGEGYVNLETGYRVLSEGYTDQWRIDGTLGWQPPRTKWRVLLETQNTFAAGSGRAGYDLARVRTSLLRPLRETLFFQAGHSADLAGSHIGLGQGAFFALWLQF